MDTVSKASKTLDSDGLKLNLTHKINLNRSDKYFIILEKLLKRVTKKNYKRQIKQCLELKK